MKHLVKDEAQKKEARGGKILSEKHNPTPVSTVKEVIDAVLKAKEEKKVIRVVGSEHSCEAAIFPVDGVTLKLTGELQQVKILNKTKENGEDWLYCSVGAGCYLGKNPMDPNSSMENSACKRVEAEGFGFPELGGIIHQTVGGFIMTGSAGGSLNHSFSDVIQDIKFVDGNGQVQTAEPNSELWCAVGVSMGLFGVITEVKFRLPPMKFVTGTESTQTFADSMLGPDKNGQSRLKESLEKHEYMRVNWFPQKKLMRVQEWVAEQSFENKDLVPYNSILSDPLMASLAAFVLSLCDCLLQMPDSVPHKYETIGCCLSRFVPLTKDPKYFYDVWYHALPMDNEAQVDRIIKVDFTEIWVPLDQCQTVIDKLQTLFAENQKAAGNFATEIYSAKRCPFWMSMSYNQDMVRVDPYWFVCNKGDLRTYFSYFWDVLLDIPDTRLHWGKYLPLPGQKCGNTTFNAEYLKKVYPKMDDWLKLRKKHDPDQVFVTDYWRGILDIKPKSQ